MFVEITKMLLKTVFNSATAQQLMQLSEDLKIIRLMPLASGQDFQNTLCPTVTYHSYEQSIFAQWKRCR